MMSLHGLLNGRGGSDGSSDSVEFQTCQSTSSSNVCVCPRAHYHIALEEAIIPSPNNGMGVFVVSEDNEGVSPMYTEPYWSNGIGVHVNWASGATVNWTLGIGLVTSAGCIKYAPSKGKVVLRISFISITLTCDLLFLQFYILFSAAISHQLPGFKASLKGMPRTCNQTHFSKSHVY